MKRIIILILAVIMMASLVSCGKKDVDDSKNTSQSVTQNTENKVEAEESMPDTEETQPTEAEIAMKAYEDVLNNKIKVYETDIEEYNYLADCKTPYNRIMLSECEELGYAYTDLDGDMVKELVIDCGDTLILRYYEGTVCVYPFTFRQLYYLNTDGSHAWNHTGQNFEDNPKTEVEFTALEAFWQNKISKAEAIQLAKDYWERFDIEENGYMVAIAQNSWAPSSVYVLVIKWRVYDHDSTFHYSTFDEIWIDKTTGEAIIPFAPDGKG